MSTAVRFRAYSLATLLLAVVTIALVLTYYPPEIEARWVVALGTLLLLAILSAYLALTVTEGGASTAADFLAHLAAVVMLGPAGAVVLVIVQAVVTELVMLKKPIFIALFNLGQFVMLTAVAGVVYQLFGGVPSLDSIQLRQAFPPFVVAVIAYWATNSVLASYAVSIAERRPAFEVWRQAIGVVIVFDVAMSSLAFVIALMYVRWGQASLLAAIIPMIGLRYSYGVNIQLQQLNQDLLRVLIKTLEARDKYTSGHSVRVSERSRRVAEQLGVRGRQLRNIETGALLHDI